MDFKFSCPYCTQHIAGPVELAGLEVNCPTCGMAFNVPAPADPNQTEQVILTQGHADATASDQMQHWLVDVRVLVVGAPPAYMEMLIEVPQYWVLPKDNTLPAMALELVKKAVKIKFAPCPVTPTKVRTANLEALWRVSDPPDFTDGGCRVWFLGKHSTGG